MGASPTPTRPLPPPIPKRRPTADSRLRWARGSIVLGEPLSPTTLRDDTQVTLTCPIEEKSSSEDRRAETAQLATRTFSLSAFVGFVVVGFALGSVICGETNLLLGGLLRAGLFLALASFAWKFLDELRTGQLRVDDLLRRGNLSSSAALWIARGRRGLEALRQRLLSR